MKEMDNIYNFYWWIRQVMENERSVSNHLIKKDPPFLFPQQNVYNQFMQNVLQKYMQQHFFVKQLSFKVNEQKWEGFLSIKNILYSICKMPNIKQQYQQRLEQSLRFINNLYSYEEIFNGIYLSMTSLRFHHNPKSSLQNKNNFGQNVNHLIKSLEVYSSFIILASGSSNINYQAATKFYHQNKKELPFMMDRFQSILRDKTYLQKIKYTAREYFNRQRNEMFNQSNNIVEELIAEGLNAISQLNAVINVINSITKALKQGKEQFKVDHNQLNLTHSTMISQLMKSINQHKKPLNSSTNEAEFNKMVEFINLNYNRLSPENKFRGGIKSIQEKMNAIQFVLNSKINMSVSLPVNGSVNFNNNIQLNDLRQQNRKYQQQLKSIKDYLYQSQRKLQMIYDASNMSCQGNENNLLTKLQNLYSKVDSDIALINQLKNQINERQIQKADISSKHARQILDLRKQIDDLNKSLKIKDENWLKQNMMVRTLQRQLNLQKEQISRLIESNSILKNQLNDLKQKQRGFEAQKQRQFINLQNKVKQQMEEQKDMLANHHKQIQKMKASKKLIQDELSSNKQDIKETKMLLIKSKDQIKKLQKDIENQKIKTQSLQSKSQIHLREYQNLKIQIKQIDTYRQKISQQLNIYKIKEQEQKKEKNKLKDGMVSYTATLFNDQLFYNKQPQKQVLIKHLQKYMKSPIKRSPLVYKYDPKNKTNFHQYIDNVKNICLIVKTPFAIIAGFYPGIHTDQGVMSRGGLLVSVTNDQSYTLYKKKQADKVTPKGMTYDQFYIIYGNAEIRIKPGQKTILSNFAVNNGYYDARGHKINDFLNDGDKRQVEFQSYEIYSLEFKHEGYNQI